MRAFFAGGANKMRLPWAVDALPLLIHVSLFLFFSGLVVFMRSINHSVYLSIISAIGVFSAVYVSFTCMPMFWPDSPYNTPLSLVVFFMLKAITDSVMYTLVTSFGFVEATVLIVFSLLLFCLLAVWVIIFLCLYMLFLIVRLCLRLVFGAHRLRDLSNKLEQLIAGRPRVELPLVDLSRILGVPKRFKERFVSRLGRITLPQKWVPTYSRNAAEKLASKRLPAIDLSILKWTIGALEDDDTLEKFFEDIPGFFHSQTVKGLTKPLPYPFLSRFFGSLGGFLARTLSSNPVDETVRTRRLETCIKAIKEICDDGGPSNIFFHLSSLRFDQVPPSIHTAVILERWYASSDRDTSAIARYTLAKMLPYVRERDVRWIALAQDVFGLPERLLRDHIAHGDESVLLVILICAARRVISTEPWKWEMLWSISQFDVLNTLPELRNHFCSLWNEIVLAGNNSLSKYHHLDVLRGIRHLYIALHQGTDSAPTYFDGSTPSHDGYLYSLSSYPSCSISTHGLDPTVPRLPEARLDDAHNHSPPPPPSESQPTPGGSTVPQQAIKAIDIAGRPSSTYCSPLHSQQSSSPGPNTATGHTTVPLDINRRLIAETSHFSHQSSLSTGALTTNIVRSGDPTTDVPVNEMGQTSQTPTPTFHTLPHSDAVAVVFTPSTVPFSPGKNFDTFLPITLALMFSHPPENGTEQQVITTRQSASANTQVLPTADQVPQFIPNIGATLQTGDKPTGDHPTPDSGSLSSPTIMPIFHSGTIHEEFDSSLESALMERHNIQHPSGSRLTTAGSDNSPQITSVVDAHATMISSLSISSTQSNTRDITYSISMEAVGHENSPEPSTPDIAEHTSALGDRQDD